MGGAPRQVSEVCKRYVTQRGSVVTRMGLGFNVCVAPTVTFCPCIFGWRGELRFREGEMRIKL